MTSKKLFLNLSAIVSVITILLGACSDNISRESEELGNGFNTSKADNVTDKSSNDVFAKGADISWLTQMEDENIIFRFTNGETGNCIDILKEQGINSVRFRLWVNPEGKYCSTEDVLEKAKRANDAGLDIMLDFHYSDSWADPGKQTIPAAWHGLNSDQLTDKIYEYTKSTLEIFKSQGIAPRWVQVGNETGNGMLWPFGKADTSPKIYAQFNNAGYDAVKAVFPEAKVIVHLQNGQDADLFKWLFGLLEANGGKWDMIGMSLYPEKDNYESMVLQCKSTMLEMISKYNKDVMLCEVGMGNSYVSECKKLLELCLGLEDEIPGGRFLGVFYWEPQVYNDWNGYKKGAFTSDGSPSAALEAFKQNSSGITAIYPD